MKTFLWLILFPPVGIYLLIKGNKKDSNEGTESPPAEKRSSNSLKTKIDNIPREYALPWLLFFPPIGIYIILRHNNDDSPIYLQAIRLVSKTILLFAPLVIILNLFVSPENEKLQESIIFGYLFLGIPFFKYPQHRKKIAAAGLVLGSIVLLAESGVSSEDLESWWIKIPFLVIGTILYFVITGMLAAKSDDPELKALMAERSFKKEDIKTLLIAGAGICIAIGAYAVWENRDTLVELFKNAGIFVGFVLIAIGNVFLGSKDGRFRTGFKGNFEPNYKIAFSCFAVGIPWFLYGVMN